MESWIVIEISATFNMSVSWIWFNSHLLTNSDLIFIAYYLEDKVFFSLTKFSSKFILMFKIMKIKLLKMVTIKVVLLDSSLLAILIKLYVMLWYSLNYYTQINFIVFNDA